MLANKQLKAFVPTTMPEKAKTFYEEVLGLTLLSQDKFALEFHGNGTGLRVITVPQLTPHNFTALGWNIDDIKATIKELNGKGIVCEQYDYDFMKQDELGIWISPGGAQVAWFKDPDGNILSLTQH